MVDVVDVLRFDVVAPQWWDVEVRISPGRARHRHTIVGQVVDVVEP